MSGGDDGAALRSALEAFATRVPVEDRFDDVVAEWAAAPSMARPQRPRVVVWAVAAACVALVVAAVVIVASRAPDGTPADRPAATDVPGDGVGPLFVLPEDREGLTHGQIADGLTEYDDGPVVLAGVRDGSAYRDLFAIAVFDHAVDTSAAAAPPGAAWQAVTLPTGEAQVLSTAGSTSVVQQRGTRWLRVDASSSVAARAMEAVTIGADGTPSLSSDDLVVLATRLPGRGRLATTLLVTPDGITVESVTASSAIGPEMSGTDRAVPVVVRGHAGWLFETQAGGATHRQLRWLEATGQEIIVSGDATAEDLMAVADGLTVVDEATWRDAVQMRTAAEAVADAAATTTTSVAVEPIATDAAGGVP